MKCAMFLKCREWLIDSIEANPGISTQELLKLYDIDNEEDDRSMYPVLFYKTVKLAGDYIFAARGYKGKECYYFSDRVALDKCKTWIQEQVKGEINIAQLEDNDEYYSSGCIRVAIEELRGIIFIRDKTLSCNPIIPTRHKSKLDLCKLWLLEYLTKNKRVDIKRLLEDAAVLGYNKQMIYKSRQKNFKYERIGWKSYWSIGKIKQDAKLKLQVL